MRPQEKGGKDGGLMQGANRQVPIGNATDPLRSTRIEKQLRALADKAEPWVVDSAQGQTIGNDREYRALYDLSHKINPESQDATGWRPVVATQSTRITEATEATSDSIGHTYQRDYGSGQLGNGQELSDDRGYDFANDPHHKPDHESQSATGLRPVVSTPSTRIKEAAEATSDFNGNTYQRNYGSVHNNEDRDDAADRDNINDETGPGGFAPPQGSGTGQSGAHAPKEEKEAKSQGVGAANVGEHSKGAAASSGDETSKTDYKRAAADDNKLSMATINCTSLKGREAALWQKLEQTPDSRLPSVIVVQEHRLHQAAQIKEARDRAKKLGYQSVWGPAQKGKKLGQTGASGGVAILAVPWLKLQLADANAHIPAPWRHRLLLGTVTMGANR